MRFVECGPKRMFSLVRAFGCRPKAPHLSHRPIAGGHTERHTPQMPPSIQAFNLFKTSALMRVAKFGQCP